MHLKPIPRRISTKTASTTSGSVGGNC